MNKMLIFSSVMIVTCIANGMESDQQSQKSLQNVDLQEYQGRRQKLLQQVREKYQDAGPILLVSGFEKCRGFRQEDTFYYFTGLKDSTLVLLFDEHETLLLTNDDEKVRSQWVDYGESKESLEQYGIGIVKYMGQRQRWPTFPFPDRKSVENLVSLIQKYAAEKKKMYAQDSISHTLQSEHVAFLRHMYELANLSRHECIEDIYPEIIALRKQKSAEEIKKIVHAINVTEKTFRYIARKIKPGMTEADIHAKVDGHFIKQGAIHSPYPCIACTGKNTCVLHHLPANTEKVKNGDLFLLDAGAEIDMYCADVTRTFPVSGKFTERQKEIYSIVLEAQEYIARIARPGMILTRYDEPEKSLTNLTLQFLKEKGGYDVYMPHGVSHYLGLDVHDVGTFDCKPIEEGSVITIEPGIYIAGENIGIRIEDNYLITKDGAVCLSSHLPKSIEDIEKLMAEKKESISEALS